jgi:hypothetical protein
MAATRRSQRGAFWGGADGEALAGATGCGCGFGSGVTGRPAAIDDRRELLKTGARLRIAKQIRHLDWNTEQPRPMPRPA